MSARAPHAVPPGPALPSPYASGELYDLVLGGFDEDLDYYVGHACAARGPVLEVACGTGRVLLPMLEAGVDAEGVELEPAMLEVLRRKAAARGLPARARPGDMRRLELPRRFALVLIPFNTFVHNLTAEDQIATLRGCHAQLRPGGALRMDLMCPTPQMLAEPDGEPVLELEVPHPETGLPVRLWDTRWKDAAAQVQRSVIEIEELDALGGSRRHRSETRVRWVHVQEMALLLRLAGFARWEIHGDFDGSPIGPSTSFMVVSAWREGA